MAERPALCVKANNAIHSEPGRRELIQSKLIDPALIPDNASSIDSQACYADYPLTAERKKQFHTNLDNDTLHIYGQPR